MSGITSNGRIKAVEQGERVALILAGGGGTRLWPASTGARPKQLLSLLGNGEPSLLAATVARARALVPADNIWIVTTHAQRDAVAAAVPGCPREHIIAEPRGRNTAPCLALALHHVRADLRARGGSDARVDAAVVFVLPADHHVEHVARFTALLERAAGHAAGSGAFVTLGITPDHPSSAYGYIERGARIAGDDATLDTDLPDTDQDATRGINRDTNLEARDTTLDTAPNHDASPDANADLDGIFAGLHFVEKPDRAQAERYLQSGRFLWNAGIFVMTVGALRRAFETHAPALTRALAPVAAALARDDAAAAARAAQDAYARVDAEPFDIAIMERLDAFAVIPAAVGWTDLGSWRAVHGVLPRDERGNAACLHGRRVAVLEDTKNSLVWSEDADVAVVGLEGVAVICSGGRVLVCPLERAQDVRGVAQAMDARARADSSDDA